MEETLEQLRQEVARLRELSARQSKLLRELLAARGPGPDVPVSLPIQCTEGAEPGDGERAPGILRREGAPGESAVPAGPRGPVRIRGPVEPSWTPRWLLDPGDAPTRDACRDVLPPEHAGRLQHVLGHTK